MTKDNTNKVKKIILDGDRSIEVLNNQAYIDSMTELKGELFSEWIDTKWFQYKKREALWRLIRSANEFEVSLLKKIRAKNSELSRLNRKSTKNI